MADPHTYSDDEIKEIIEHALAHGGGSATRISRQELLAIGEQVGIPASAMAVSADEVLQKRAQRTQHESKQAGRRRWLKAHALLFAVVNLLLFGVNFASTPGEWWVLFPVFFWGLALAAHAGVVRWLAGREESRPSNDARLRVASRVRAPLTEPTDAQQETVDDERGQKARR